MYSYVNNKFEECGIHYRYFWCHLVLKRMVGEL